MSFSSKTYNKRNGPYSQIDAICLRLQEELKSFKDDKNYKKIKKQIFSRFAEQEHILPRRLKYIYKSFEMRGTTKKFSGQMSCFSYFDEKIFQELKFLDFNQKDLKKAVKSLALQIIKPHIPSFKCSDAYIRRLLTRFEKWRQSVFDLIFDDDDFSDFFDSNAKPFEETEADLCIAATQDETINTQMREKSPLPKDEKNDFSFLMREVVTLSNDAPIENQGFSKILEEILEEIPTFPAADFMGGYFSPSRFITEEITNVYRGDYSYDGEN